MSGPSLKAIAAAQSVRRLGITAALSAAHDPALGLDRSVCLRDVVAWLEECADDAILEVAAHYFRNASGAIEREFGGGS